MKLLRSVKSAAVTIRDGRVYIQGPESAGSAPIQCEGEITVASEAFFRAEAVYGLDSCKIDAAAGTLTVKKGRGRMVIQGVEGPVPEIEPGDMATILPLDIDAFKQLAGLGKDEDPRPEACALIGQDTGVAVIMEGGVGGAFLDIPALGDDPLLLPVRAAKFLVQGAPPSQMLRDGEFIWAEYEDGTQMRFSSFALEDQRRSRIFSVLVPPEDVSWWVVPQDWREALDRILKTSPTRVVLNPTSMKAIGDGSAIEETEETPITGELQIVPSLMKKIMPHANEMDWSTSPDKVFWRGQHLSGVFRKLEVY